MNKLIYIPTNQEFETIQTCLTTAINAPISTFEKKRIVNKGRDEIIIKDYLHFNKSRKATRSLWKLV